MDSSSVDHKHLAHSLYEALIQKANVFLRDCQGLSMQFLVQENPTYEQVAQQFEVVARIVAELSLGWDPMLGQKAFDYASMMTRIGRAIRNEDVEQLSQLVLELQEKPGL